MNRKFFAYTLSMAVALTCATFLFSTTTHAAGGGAAPGGAAAAPGGAPGGAGGRGARGGAGGPGGAGGGAGAFGGGAGGGAGAFGGGAGGGAGRGAGGPGGGRGAPTPLGEAAPIPPQVKQLSADEVAKVNADIKRMIESDASADKALLLRAQSLLTLAPPRSPNPAATFTRSGVRSDQRHLPFVEQAKTANVDVLFEGDSITDFWQTTGKEVLAKHFGDVKLANFAISGDTTQGLLWGLKNGEGRDGEIPVKMQPKAIMLMIGTNNTGNSSGPEIAEGVGAVVLELRRDFPNAKIMLLAIFPRGNSAADGNRIKNEQANQLLAKLDDKQHVFFTNINDKFLKPDGSLIGFGGDNLHPNAEGYEIWAKAVEDTLKSWAK